MPDDDLSDDALNVRWRPSWRKHFLVPLFWLASAMALIALLVG